MKKAVLIYSLISSLFFIPGKNILHAAPSSVNTIKRYAIIIGANNGGPTRVLLRYAKSDAYSFFSVLTKMGGVQPGDATFLFEPTQKQIYKTLQSFHQKTRLAKKKFRRVELIFYYSGHSDEEGILIKGEKTYYKTIKKKITRIPAHVHIAILDSCSSGAFTLNKGGKMKSPFMIDRSYNMKGFAFMTSSSSDEVSQESEKIKGSFFTHYLVAGLRGAADMSRDGRVTLNEAYQFAYKETLGRTEKTLSGPQHPNYNIQMSGTGDVVITEIRRSSSILILNSDISGRIAIRDGNNNLVVETHKSRGRQMQLGLEHGSYTVLNQSQGRLSQAKINLFNRRGLLLSRSSFDYISRESTVSRGNSNETSLQEYKRKTFSFIFLPSFDKREKTIQTATLHLVGNSCAKLDGINIGIGPSIVYEDVDGIQIGALGNYSGGDMSHLQISALFNYVRNTANGVQIAPIFNNVNSNFTGVQAAGIFNNAGTLSGVQVAGVCNIANGETDGVQVAGLFNIATGNTDGVQVSGLFNTSAGDTDGVQIASLFNYTGANLDGVQTSILFNQAENIKGVQVSLINSAKTVKGVQLGLINIADDNSGLAIGLLNISKNGAGSADIYTNNITGVNLGFKFRVGYTYTMFSYGIVNQLQETNVKDSESAGFHLGGHLPMENFYIALDAGYIFVHNRQENIEDQGAIESRLSFGYHVNKHMSLYTGAGIDYIYSINKAFNDGRYRPHFFTGVSFYFYHGDYNKI